jgi:intein/homing endonuclease
MQLVDVAWMAGLWEGEGYIVFTGKEGSLKIGVGMTDEDVIQKFARLYGRGGVYLTRSKKGFKDQWTFRAYGRYAYALAVMLYPFLGTRRRGQVRAAVKKWIGRVDRRRKLSQESLKTLHSMLASGISQRTISTTLGVSESTVSAYKTGRAGNGSDRGAARAHGPNCKCVWH